MVISSAFSFMKRMNISFDEERSGSFLGDFDDIKVSPITYRGWCLIADDGTWCEFEKGKEYKFTIQIVPTFFPFFLRDAEDYEITINGQKPLAVYFSKPAKISSLWGKFLRYPKALCVEFSFVCE